jgi:hypothetical protein
MKRRRIYRSETPEPVLEKAILRLWHIRIAEQLCWLEGRRYKSQEGVVAVKEWHSMLSYQAVDFLDLMLRDTHQLEQELRGMVRANKNHKRRGGQGADRGQRLSTQRVIKFLQNRWDMGHEQASAVVRELRGFVSVIREYSV